MNDYIDPMLSPKACGDQIGMSDEFIVGEIRDGRLIARKRTYQSGRTRYRIDPMDFHDYKERYWPQTRSESA